MFASRKLAATAISVAVAVYLVIRRRVGDGEFLALLLVLCLALVILHRAVDPAVEMFMDSTTAIYNDLLHPRLDRLVKAVGGQRTVNANQPYIEDDSQVMKEARGQDIADAIGSSDLSVANEFRLISALLCNCAQTVDQATLLGHIGLGAPVYLAENESPDMSTSL